VQIVGSVVIVLPAVLLVLMVGALVTAAGGEDAAPLALIPAFPLVGLASIFLGLITVPFVIRAMIVQDFAQSLNLGWAWSFVRIMFWDMVFQGIAYAFLAMGAAIFGLLLLCVGYLPALGVVSGAGMNLLAQWYEVYLSRGGEPAPSPLSSEPIIEATVL
jgi:hypothetical protein